MATPTNTQQVMKRWPHIVRAIRREAHNSITEAAATVLAYVHFWPGGDYCYHDPMGLLCLAIRNRNI